MAPLKSLLPTVDSFSEAPGSALPLRHLLSIMGTIFVAFPLTAIVMPVEPLHVHDVFGLSIFVVGLVAAIQFVTALLSRPLASQSADSIGAQQLVVAGSPSVTSRRSHGAVEDEPDFLPVQRRIT